MNIKNLDTFGKRLEFILDLKDIKNKDLAQAINKAPNTITGYIKDLRSPDLETLKKISDFLNVNASFFLLQTDSYETYISRDVDGKLIEITFDDEKLHLTEKEITDLFEKLKSVGFDVKKLL